MDGHVFLPIPHSMCLSTCHCSCCYRRSRLSQPASRGWRHRTGKQVLLSTSSWHGLRTWKSIANKLTALYLSYFKRSRHQHSSAASLTSRHRHPAPPVGASDPLRRQEIPVSTVMVVDGFQKLCLGFLRTSSKHPYVAKVDIVIPLGEEKAYEWIELPQTGRINWWFTIMQSQVFYAARTSLSLV